MLNPNVNTHVYNNKEDFTFLYLVAENNYLIAGGNFVKI